MRDIPSNENILCLHTEDSLNICWMNKSDVEDTFLSQKQMHLKANSLRKICEFFLIATDLILFYIANNI